MMPFICRRLRSCAACVMLTCCWLAILPHVLAQSSSTWNATSGGSWTVDSNWLNGAPTDPGDVAVFAGARPSANAVISLPAGIALGNLIDGSSRSITLQGSDALTFDDLDGAALIVVPLSTGQLTIQAPLSVGVGDQLTVRVAAGATFRSENGIVASGSAITKEDAGTWRLVAESPAWTGPLEIAAGVVSVASSGALGGGPIGSASATTVRTAGRLQLESNVAGEQVQLDGGRLHSVGGHTISGTVRLTSDSFFSSEDADQSLTVSSMVIGPSGLIVDRGAVTFSTANMYEGLTRVTGGTLIVAHSQALGSPTSGTRVEGGRLVIDQPIGEPIELSAGEIALKSASPGMIHATGGTVFYDAATAAASVLLEGGTLAVNRSLAIAGLLAPASTGGDILLARQSKFDNGGTNQLDLGNLPQGGSGFRLGSDGVSTMSASMTLVPPAGNQTLAVGAGRGELRLPLVLTDPAGAGPLQIEQDGPGATVLSGANTYTGPTWIRRGVLEIDNSRALGTGSGSATDGTTVLAGGELLVDNVTNVSGELVRLEGGTLNFSSRTLARQWQAPLEIVTKSWIRGTPATNISAPITGRGNLHLDHANLTLSGAHDFAGTMVIEGGQVTASSVGALGSTAGATEVRAGRLVLDGPTSEPLVLDDGEIQINAASAAHTKAIVSRGGLLQLPANVRFAAPLALDSGQTRLNGTNAVFGGGSGGSGNLLINDSRITIDGQPLGHVGDLLVQSGQVTFNGANSYSGLTTIQRGRVVVNHPQALGSPAAATRLEQGAELLLDVSSDEPIEILSDSRLELPANAGAIRANLKMGRGQLWLNGTELQGNVELLAGYPTERPILRGGKWSAKLTGAGGFALSHDDLEPAEFSGDNSYRGTTYLYAGGFDVRHANALGRPDVGTRIEGGTLIVSAASVEPVLLAHSGTVRYATAQGKLPIFVDDPARLAHHFSFGTLLLDSPGSYRESVELFETQVEVNAQTQIQGLTLKSPRAAVHVASGQELKVDGTVQIAAGRIDGQISGQQLRKVSAGRAELASLGAFAGEINVANGLVDIYDGGAFGSTAGVTVVSGPQSALRVVGSLRSREHIELSNHHGLDEAAGAIYVAVQDNEASVELEGTLDLGDRGATLGGDHRSNLYLRGPVVGGDLEVRGGRIWIAGDQAQYRGATILHDGIFVLMPDAVLQHTQRVELHPRARLFLDQQRLGPHQQIGDQIPIESYGGLIQIGTGNGPPTEEVVGPVALRQGLTNVSATVGATSDGDVLRITSLTQHAGATIVFELGDNSRFSIAQPPPLQHGLLGGWAAVDAGLAFATIDAQGSVRRAVESTTQVNNATNTDTVLLESPATLSTSKTIHALNGQAELNLAGNTLTLQSGGLISHGLTNGRVTAGNGEAAALYLFGRGGIAADIVDQGAGSVSLIVNGPYAHVITGNNSYSGSTTINGADVTFTFTGSLPAGTELQINGGSVVLGESSVYRVDELVLRDGAQLFGGELDSPNTVLEDGYVGNQGLVGSGTIVKSTRGSVQIGNLNRFAGDVMVNEGFLETYGNAGSARLIVNGGTLRTRTDDNAQVTASVVLRQGVWQTGSGHLTTPVDAEAPIRIVAQGATIDELRGVGDVTIDAEERRARVTLLNAQSYTGNLRVERGSLLLREAALHNLRHLTIAEDGILELSDGALTVPVVLAGGTIAARAETQIDSAIDVQGAARLEVSNFAAPITVNGEIRLSDQSELISYGDESAPIRIDGPIVVSGAVSWNNQWGSAVLSGPVRAQHPAASLQLTGASRAAIVLDASYEIPQQRSLRIDLGTDSKELLVMGAGHYVRGGGTLRNSLTVRQQAILDPGDGVGRLTVEGTVQLDAGAVWNWQVNSTTGSPGANWDLLDVEGTLALSGADDNPISIRVQPVNNSGQPGAIAGFQPDGEHRWTIADSASAPTLDLSHVRFDLSSLSPWHTIPAGYGFWLQPEGNQLQLHYGDVHVAGDFNDNSQLDVVDIDLLSVAVRRGDDEARFDLNDDGQVDTSDRIVWVESLKSTYFGDANLDGQFNSSDLVAVFVVGQYEDVIPGNSTWASGDWTGDGECSTSDFVYVFQRGGYEQGPRPAAPMPVPEPASWWLFALATASRLHGRRSLATPNRDQDSAGQ